MKGLLLPILLVLIASGCLTSDKQVPLIPQITTTSQVQETVKEAGLVLESFSQAHCPENYLQDRYENQISFSRSMEAGSSVETMTVMHLLDYVCCANITVFMNASREGSDTVINLYERNIGQVCRCICGYNITAKISGIGKNEFYLIRVFGVDYNGEGSKLIRELHTDPEMAGLGEACGNSGYKTIHCRAGLECDIVVSGDYPEGTGVCTGPAEEEECLVDADCAVGGCSGQVCSTKEKASGIVTTCEWREEYGCYKMTSCGCVNRRCAWAANEDFESCLREKSAITGPVTVYDL